MTERHESLLRLTGLHTIMLPVVLVRLFGASVKNVVKKLKERGQLQAREGLSGRAVYYQLTTEACAELGHPEHRSKAPGSGALCHHLSVLWYTTFSTVRRELWEAAKVAEVTGANVTQPHIVEMGERVRILSVYVPDPHSRPKNCLRAIRHRIKAINELPELTEWIDSRQYGVLVLVETKGRKERLEKLAKKYFPKIYIRVDQSVGPSTIAESIRKENHREKVSAPR